MEKNTELHYRYIISYLFAAIVLLITLKYYDIPNLVDKFSFALTLSSLLLAILAIFYTIIAANKQDSQLTKLIETNTNLAEAAFEIKATAQDIRSWEAPQHFQNIDKNLKSLSDSFSTLIPKEQVESETEVIDDLGGKCGGDEQPENKVERIVLVGDIVIDLGSFQFAAMFVRLHFSAMGVLYLFSESYRNNKSINENIFEKLNLVSFEYGIGVLAGLESIGIISFKVHKGEIMPITCCEMVINETKNNLLRVKKVAKEKESERISTLMAAIEAHVA